MSSSPTVAVSGRRPVADVENFDFAEPWRRISANSINWGSFVVVAALFDLMPSLSPAVPLTVLSLLGAGQLVCVFVLRNSLGGLLTSSQPVGYDGEPMPGLAFARREILAYGSVGFMFFIVGFPLAVAFKLLALAANLATSDAFPEDLGQSGVARVVGQSVCLAAIAVWAYFDFRVPPYHQAWHDRFIRTVVVRRRW